MTAIYHITPRDVWSAAQEKGFYEADSLSIEGFIHCSTAEQAAPVANAFYSAQRGLVLLVIDSDRLTSELKWEDPVHPASESAPRSLHGKFPHIYGRLNLDAVADVLPFEANAEGLFTFSA
ncbi:MAG: DUF952 domain-containing protein [Anaerolineales bacterium]|nr:DUF952 domain-containing protein [Anaerolineales bacterium]